MIFSFTRSILLELWLLTGAKIYHQFKFRSVPDKWRQGEMGCIVLIHGFPSSWHSMGNLGNALNDLGYKVNFMPQLGWQTLSISKAVRIAEEYIKKLHENELIILGHSKGGIIAKNIALKLPDNIRQIITVASPNKGITWPKLKLFNLYELGNNSIYIQNIQAPQPKINYLNIYASVDNAIVPNTSLSSKYGENHLIKTFGHNTVLYNHELVKKIIAFIRI